MPEQQTDDDLSRVEKLIGVSLDDDDKGRVQAYIVDAKQAIMAYIGQYVDSFPPELNYLVDELVLAKFNKFHNEGMNSISEQGLSITYTSNDLKDYLGDIQAWIDAHGNDALDGDAIGWW